MRQAPAISIISVVEAMRRPDESLLDAATRLIIEEALYREGTQIRAAKLIGMSPRVMNYQLGKFAGRPKDQADAESGPRPVVRRFPLAPARGAYP